MSGPLCAEQIWLGDPGDYHDQPMYSCRLPAGHFKEDGSFHEAVGLGSGATARGRFTVPAFKVTWADYPDSIFCARCDVPIKLKRDQYAPDVCPACGGKVVQDSGYYAIAPKALR